jgi:hypothetical protein
MFDDLPDAPTPEGPRRKAIPPRVWGPVVLGILGAVFATFVYAIHEHRLVKQLSAEKNEMAASLDASHNLVAALTNRVSELSVKQPHAATTPFRPAMSQPAGGSSVQAEDVRWKEIQAQLAEQQKQINAMATTKAMLQASIAHTHDELEALEKKTQRKYYEFDLGKSSLFHWQGPVALRLQKADPKHQYVDLEMIVGNDQFTKRHIPLFEPVYVYSATGRQSAELVINGISDGRVHGYVAEAKYRSSGLEAMVAPAGRTPSGQTAPPKPRLQPAKD